MSAPSQRTRGSIWWCDFSPKVPSHLPAPASLTGCAQDGTILCEYLRTVSVDRLSGPRLGQAAPALMAQVDACLKRLLALA